MYKFLFEMKGDLNELKKLVSELIKHGTDFQLSPDQAAMVNRYYPETGTTSVDERHLIEAAVPFVAKPTVTNEQTEHEFDQVIESEYDNHEEIEDNLSLENVEKVMIIKALEKHRGKRKYAAEDLGISERTLYRKIKEYNLDA
jgi:transcriptional regulator with PAS, ATPase and Fis domain